MRESLKQMFHTLELDISCIDITEHNKTKIIPDLKRNLKQLKTTIERLEIFY